MNEEKIKDILKKIGSSDIPGNVKLIAENVSRNFDMSLKAVQPKEPVFTFYRLLAAAAVILIAFAAGRWSKIAGPTPPFEITANPVSAYSLSDKKTGSFWQQKAMAAMNQKPQASFANIERLSAYKQYLKEKYND